MSTKYCWPTNFNKIATEIQIFQRSPYYIKGVSFLILDEILQDRFLKVTFVGGVGQIFAYEPIRSNRQTNGS